MTATVLLSTRAVSIKIPANLSLATTKSFGHLIFTSKPISASARRQANATTNASEPSSYCGLSNAQPKLNIRHSPCRLTQLRPCRPRPLVWKCATHKALCAKPADRRANAMISSLLDEHSCFNCARKPCFPAICCRDSSANTAKGRTKRHCPSCWRSKPRIWPGICCQNPFNCCGFIPTTRAN